MRAVRSIGGFALVESLVATVIVSIGLLGTAQLILLSLREGSEALIRTQAVTLVGDIAERIRANPDAREAYDSATYEASPAERGCADPGVAAHACSARELAEDDLAHWQSQAARVLPLESVTTVSFSDAPDGEPVRYLIEVSWFQRGETQPATLSAELQLAGASA